MAHPLTVLSYEISAGAYEAAGWGALVVALFVLLAGAPIMASRWLKTPVREPVDPAPTATPAADQTHQPEA